ncbi:InlB B-repeat-containing protein [Candidatus Aalborgicola defluviihabitans]|uniref:InlB B-repeat-containing protein n=1 Tax=Candidatus Aalborgicola defluviihabitans TaxID=3386187 RepID=UPI003909D235|nr:hypothetical protein [Burkholderiales bacterium]
MTSNLLKKALAALFGLLVLTAGAHAANITVSGNLNAGSPTFNRPTDRAGFPDSANNALPYNAIEIKTGSLGGTITATINGGSTEFDSFLALYSSFSEGSPGANLLAADDDGGAYPHALLTANGLAANTSYWLVVTSYSGTANAVFPLYGNYSVTISGDLPSYAITATANPPAGGTVSCTPNPVPQGGASTCAASANLGYSFTGFSGACTGATCVLSNVTSDASVTANFAINTYAITTTASPLAGGSVSCTPNPVSYGSNSTCTATANLGYTFTGFSGACTGATCVLSNVTSAQSVTANFTLNTYAITTMASPLAGGSVSCTPNPVTYGGNSTCTATANAGYTFSAFSGACTGVTCVLSNVTSAQSVTATFTLNTYAITTTASPLAGGSVSCTPNPVPHGSSSTCTATANPNYTFTAFSGACTGASCVLSNVTSVQSVTATFTLNAYAITTTASPLAGGSVSCTPNPVPHGSNSTCTATANAGYTFSAFSGACTGATCVLSNVTSVQSVTATFTLNTYAITTMASPLAGGSVSCTPNPVPHGSNSTCTATANAGYTFSAFSGACTGATCVLSNVTSVQSVTAIFTLNTYAITATASPVAGGSVSCTPNPVQHGSSSTCTATANVGYNFSSFSGDCTGATCVLNNVTTVKAVTATFLVNTPPVASNVGINGSLQISRILTGRYTYSDAQNDPQGISTFRWMRDSQSSGATKVAVPGATSISYAVVSIAQSRYLFFCVTPVATSGVTTGVEVCSSAVDTELGNPPPPPPVFPPGPFPWAGMVTAPTVLDLHTEKGTATMVGVASVLERVLSPGLRFVGQSSLGIVVMAAPNGQNYVFAPLAVQFNDPRADGLYPVGNGQYQVVVSGTALLIVPAVQNLDELVGLLPAGATARMENNGVLSAAVDGQTYVVQPSFWSKPQFNLSAGATLTMELDGYLHFTDSKGNNQILYPAILEPDLLLRNLQSIDSSATLGIQSDGTASIRIQGQTGVWVADLVLSDVPVAKNPGPWWSDGLQRYRMRLQSIWAGALTQGFTVR